MILYSTSITVLEGSVDVVHTCDVLHVHVSASFSKPIMPNSINPWVIYTDTQLSMGNDQCCRYIAWVFVVLAYY